MILGAWIHDADSLPLEPQIARAAGCGLRSLRCYNADYALRAAPALRAEGLSLLAGIPVDGAALLQDWRSQVRRDLLAGYHALGIPLVAVCAGNEVREGGDAPATRRFTARLAFALARVLGAYREWLEAHGCATRLTYAMEGIVCDQGGTFHEWLWPLIDACDVVALNAYPMDEAAWFTAGAFEESRRFLRQPRARHDRLALFEARLRRVLQQLELAGKPLLLSETGFPSALGYRLEGPRLVIPESDGECYAAAMEEFLALLRRVDAEYGGRVEAAYFYEWRDNLYHDKIWNVEHSPIHVAFGLCDRDGTPKFDLRRLSAPAALPQGKAGAA